MKKTTIWSLLVLFILTALLLCACGGDDGGQTPSDTKKIKSDGESVFFFSESKENNFDIIYPAGDTAAAGDAASDIYAAVVEAGIPAPGVFSDTEKTESMLELLVGKTDRALSREAESLISAKISAEPDAKHWVWLYKNGQIALYANSQEAYAEGIRELSEKYMKDGVFVMSLENKSIGYVEAPEQPEQPEQPEPSEPPHEAYMSYDIPDNYYDGYEDPFSVSKKDYKRMLLTLVDEKTYRISYRDASGGTFSQDFVKKDFGMYMMGLISYKENNGKVHNITSSATDHEFVLRIGAKTAVTTRSGAHGAYPKDKTWEYFVDDTSYYNDYMLDMTFYDAKTGEKVEPKMGENVVVDGLRIVIHHNVYEMNYTKENVLVNSVRQYLYNGYDIMFDARLYMTQDVKISNSMSAMLPISKQYGNCAMFYKPDGTTVYMKTPMSNTQDETVMGVEAYVIDLWGENNPKYHMTLTLNTPEDQLMNSAEGRTDKGYCGFREMLAGASNKIYCSFMSADVTPVAWGTELHFNTTWSFSIQNDFVPPTEEPDYWVGRKND